MSDLTGLGSVFDFGSKVLDKIFPDKNEADKNKLALLQLAQSGALDELSANFKDISDARALAAQDIAGGNNFTKFLSATVRPVAGYLAMAAVAYSVIVHQPLDPMVKDVVETIIEFFFGGRVLEKLAPHVTAALSSIGGNKS